jgi:ribosomal protein S18 acetylase RimI-like enzyme
MKILSFDASDQKSVEELVWRVKFIDGSDDIPAFFHFPKGFFLIIKDDEEKVVGCGGVKPLNELVGIVKRFYIAPPLRGKGDAKELLDKLIEESKKKGYTKLVLDVYYTNIRALKFYEKHGFTRYEQSPNSDWEESLSPNEYFYYQLDII